MRTIEVSTEVFALIWGARQAGEESEDQILHRIFSGSDLKKSGKPPIIERGRRSSVLWRDDIVEGLNRLGGEADLHEIYKVVTDIRRKAGRSLPASVDAVIRRELENNSSDSESYTKQRDLFRSVNGIGGGRWALR